ncbi:biogenesis of lysosome-related organelles complex 1 subunit [Balamuthia mandrillaris]
MLARLEEFTALLNSIGKEKDQITEKLIPLLLVKAKQLESLFTVIDTFQSYVDAVKNSVDQMEERVQKTEDKYNQLNPTSIGKVLGAFRLRSTSLTQRRSANTANATQDTNDSTTTTTTEEEQKNNNNKEKEQEQEEVVGAMPTWDPQTINIINTAELLNLKQSLLAGLSSS